MSHYVIVTYETYFYKLAHKVIEIFCIIIFVTLTLYYEVKGNSLADGTIWYFLFRVSTRLKNSYILL